MEFYSYDKNKIFKGKVNGQVNPRGGGSFLQPGNSTPVPMELFLEDNEDAKFNGKAWVKTPRESSLVNLDILGDYGGKKFIHDEEGFVTDNPDFFKEEIENKIKMDISDLYDEMVADIYSEMLKVFGTSNDASAAAFASTYEAMAKRPGNYIAPHLGLTDEAGVLAYANEKITAADQYAVFRLNRIAQFESDKNAIINS